MVLPALLVLRALLVRRESLVQLVRRALQAQLELA
jgi:hypothetical protein